MAMAVEYHDIISLEYETEIFIQLCATSFNWTDLSEEVIMDVGCGREKCCQTLVELFPDIGEIVAIDKYQNIIDKNKTSPSVNDAERKIEYHCADIEDRTTLENWIGCLTVVISNQCFHQLENKEEGFRNVYQLLKPGGEAGFLFCLYTPLYAWSEEILQQPKWKEYFKFKSEVKEHRYSQKLDSSHYRAMVEQLGFNVIVCQEKHKRTPLHSDALGRDQAYDIFRHAIKDLGVTEVNIPAEFKEEFKEENFEMCMKYNTLDEDGCPCFTYVDLELLVKKPDANLSLVQ